ncbi:hypothetical protein CEXT_609681 [Caerostris extrusa]|uniref:Uncharacterized protein n=1 Tax=Caerostris extrusa TaxID=172846 RepID=A0AAV4PNE0_CAEEX|nr:hypothetical protein CEXT_609681 [Caerostris extrusa]
MLSDKNETELLLHHLQNQIIHPKWKCAIEMTRLSRGHKHSIHPTNLRNQSRVKGLVAKPSPPPTTRTPRRMKINERGSSSLEPKGGTDETKLRGAVCLANYEMGPGPKSIPYRFTEFGK